MISKSGCMTINDEALDEVKAMMQRAFKEGNKWIAFDPFADNTTGDLYCFKDFSSVAKFCSEHQLRGECIQEGYYDYYNYSVLPLANVVNAFDFQRQQLTSLELDALKSEFHRLSITPYFSISGSTARLTSGDYCPVIADRKVDVSEISGYSVLLHLYPRGMVYETGHEYKFASRVESFDDAVNTYRKTMVECALENYNRTNEVLPISELKSALTFELQGNRMPEISLIAEFKGVELKLDYECFPKDRTGVVLKLANVNNDSPRLYQSVDHMDKDSICIPQYLLAKLHSGDKEIKLYDCNFNPVQPNDKVPNMSVSYFSNGVHFNGRQIERIKNAQRVDNGGPNLS